jgi:hypothetical protein
MDKSPFKRLIYSLVFLLVSAPNLSAQVSTLRKLTDTIASAYMGGRGYTDSGLQRAAAFIEQEWISAGIIPVGKSYRQPFRHDVNVFNGDVSLTVNGVALSPGKDFIVTPGSRSVKGSNALQPLDSVRWMDPANRVVVELVDKLTWSVSKIQDDYTVFQLRKGSLSTPPAHYEAKLDAKRIKNFTSENIIGMVKGTDMQDSFLVISAHYDHLGKLGKDAVFRGANDNASGVALMLHLARQIAAKPLRYSVVFIAFAGEEAGLLGSEYFVQYPMVPLKKVRFLVNLDLLGTGDEGIMVVNATEFPKEWKILDDMNKANGWLPQVGQRGKAANSDHYWFTEAGVPAFFIYTLGGIKAYHDIYDLPETLPLTKTDEVGKLIMGFFKSISERSE